jgi:hypothetical protein
MYVVKRDQLPTPHEFDGDDRGGMGSRYCWSRPNRAGAPALHKHAYAEVFIVLEGSTFTPALTSLLNGSVTPQPPREQR